MLSEEIVIRAAGEDDLPGIFAIYNQAILHTTASYHYLPIKNEEQAGWLQHHVDTGMPVIVAECRGNIAGWACLSQFKLLEGYRHSAENSVYVSEHFQGLGIGKKLLQRLLELAPDRNIHTIIACIDSANKVSLSMHEKAGFRKAGELVEVGYKFNRWLNMTLMQYIIPA